jgi:hypothetical protein
LPKQPSSKVREANFQDAQLEVTRAVQHLEDIKVLYFRPMRMTEEIRTTDKALSYLTKVVQRLTKRIEISQKLNSDES